MNLNISHSDEFSEQPFSDQLVDDVTPYSEVGSDWSLRLQQNIKHPKDGVLDPHPVRAKSLLYWFHRSEMHTKVSHKADFLIPSVVRYPSLGSHNARMYPFLWLTMDFFATWCL